MVASNQAETKVRLKRHLGLTPLAPVVFEGEEVKLYGFRYKKVNDQKLLGWIEMMMMMKNGFLVATVSILNKGLLIVYLVAR